MRATQPGGPLTAVLALLTVVLLGALAPGAQPANAQDVPLSRDEISISFAPLVAETAPAVVSIQVRQTVTQRRVSSLFDDPFFQRFFGPQWNGGAPERRSRQAVGSGVIVRPDGLIVTNNHVISGADQITVTLNDRRSFPARLIETDERTDIALLQIEEVDGALPYLNVEQGIAADRRLAVGDLVLAIGNPFGVGQTVTIGIVSALARRAPGISDYAFFIQTDAAINPGNSGGALVDVTGRLVGINTAIFSQDGGSQGIGFAIPVRMAAAIIRSVEMEGRIVRPWFGATGQSLTPQLAEALSLERPAGVVIETVIEGSPAQAAGIRRGDVVKAIDGEAVEGVDALRFGIATIPLGERASLSILRDGEMLDIDFTASPPPEVPPRNSTVMVGQNPFAGARVANLSPAVAEELGLSVQNFSGVAVLDVAGASPARRFGFTTGDIIESVNGRDIATIVDLKQALAETAERRWSIAIRRNGRVITSTITG